MAILWTEDLATGIHLIDAQHQELFQRINSLLEACNRGKGRDEVRGVIRFLEEYVNTHFAEEERFMVKFNYSAYPDHKAQHKIFMENFEKLKSQFEAEGPGLSIVLGANHLIVDWLKSHIRRTDKDLGSFLKTKQLVDR